MREFSIISSPKSPQFKNGAQDGEYGYGMDNGQVIFYTSLLIPLRVLRYSLEQSIYVAADDSH